MEKERSEITIGETQYNTVWSPQEGYIFLICTECGHWVRKSFTNPEPRGIVCVCLCHRPSIARAESEINGWDMHRPDRQSSAA